MSIKTLSETGFIETAEPILRQVIIVKKDTIITKKTSFREELNMTSLEIAELIIGLEAEYNVKLGDWVNMNNVYNLSDIYETFLNGIYRQRKNFIKKQTLQNNKGK